MSSVPTCRCGRTCLSKEAFRGENRGRWYWKCPLSRCGFFEWNDPGLHLYTPIVFTLPESSTATSQKLNKEPTERRDIPSLPVDDAFYPLRARKSKLAGGNRSKRSRVSETVNSNKTLIQLTLYTDTDISIHANARHRYIQTLLRTVEGVVWDERIDMWVFSADQKMYQSVWNLLQRHRATFDLSGIPFAILRYLPKTTEQLHLQHQRNATAVAAAEPIPATTPTISSQDISLTQQNEATGDDNDFGDFDSFEFVVDDNTDNLSDLPIGWFQQKVVHASMLWQSMSRKQRIGVKRGAKLDGSIYLHDPIGSGQSLQALAMTLILQEDWPVLIVCRDSACQAWKSLIRSMLQLESRDICLLDRVSTYGGKKVYSSKRKAIQSRLYRQRRRELLQQQLRQGLTSTSSTSVNMQQQQQQQKQQRKVSMDGDEEVDGDEWYIGMTNNGGEDISYFGDGSTERVRTISMNGGTQGPEIHTLQKKRIRKQRPDKQRLHIELVNDSGDVYSDDDNSDDNDVNDSDTFDMNASSTNTFINSDNTFVNGTTIHLPNNDDSNNEDGEAFNQEIFDTAQFFIISYDKAKSRLSSLGAEKFKLAIFDDCHDIKKTMLPTYRSSLQRFVRSTKKTIMVSTIPVIPKPMESFPLLQIIKPNLFVDYKYFGQRYCDAKHLVFGWDYSGTSNTFELAFLLERTVLVS